MGNSNALFRVKTRTGRFSVSAVRPDLFLPFGPEEEIRRRLLEAPGFGAVPEGRIRYKGWGRPVDFCLTSGTFSSIVTDHSVPWNLLPVIEVLKDLGPFSILDAHRAGFFDRRLAVLPQTGFQDLR